MATTRSNTLYAAFIPVGTDDASVETFGALNPDIWMAPAVQPLVPVVVQPPATRVTVTVPTAVIQSVVLAALLAASGNLAVIVTAAAFLIPIDVMMLGVSNILFLIYPVRLAQTNAADFQLMGRMMLVMLLQFLILIPGVGIPAAFGGIVYWLSGFYWPAFAATSWLVLVAELPLILTVLAWVFQRFDPSTEMPA